MPTLLRPYQAELVAAIRSAMRRHQRVLAVLPTGGGKTVVFSHIAARAAERGKRVMLLAHRIELIEQISAALAREGVEHGTIAPGHPRTDHPAQIGMVQSVGRRLADLDAPDLLVVDEAHHATAGSYCNITEAWPAAFILGVSATPRRTDGSGLSDTFDVLVEGPSLRELIAAHHLADFRLFAPPSRVDMGGVRVRGGDYERAAMAEVVDRRAVIGDVIEHYAQHLGGKPAVAFCATVAHAEHVAQQFNEAGWRAASVDGTTDPAIRRDRIAAIGDGRLQILTSCDLISEGVDVPAVSGALLLRPTKSLILYLQQIGRVLRAAPGKRYAIVLDHVANSLRHGLPDAPRRWMLDAAKQRAPGEAPVKVCPACSAVIPAALGTCTECGAELDGGGGRRTPDEVAGALAEVARPDYDRLRDAPLERLVEEATSLSDMHRIAAARGFKSGWAWFRWQERETATADLAA